MALSMMASKVSYENEAFIRETVEKHGKMEVAANGDYWNDYDGQATTQAFILLDKSDNQDTYIVTFRGTELFALINGHVIWISHGWSFPVLGKLMLVS
ncbi:hypothetical protein RYX36_014795 [Vicia faba]